MRFKAKKKYKVGDEKIVTKFCLLPRKINNNTVVWLEFIFLRYVYAYTKDSGGCYNYNWNFLQYEE